MSLFKSKPINLLESYAISNIGLERPNNEDNFVVNGYYMNEKTVQNFVNCREISYDGKECLIDRPLFFAVCDGMGGEDLGEVASLTVAERFAQLYKLKEKDTDISVEKAISEANSTIHTIAAQKDMLRMGTTLALACVENGWLRVYNIGDSRVYLKRGSKLKQLSYDHTELQIYIDAKLLTPKDARSHPGRHGLVQFIGMEGNGLHPYKSKKIKLLPDDVVIICSDGVTEVLNDEELAPLIIPENSARKTSELIVRNAIEKGGNDNTTVVVVKIN